MKYMLVDNPRGNYSFLRGIAPYSSGVRAMPAFEIIHVRFTNPPPLILGFENIARFLAQINRPLQALCAMELRISDPLTFEGFREFNLRYQQELNDWDLLINDINPIARTNIAPVISGPSEPVIHAFSYTFPQQEDFNSPTFVVAGAGDLSDQSDLSPSAIIRPQEVGPDALKEKAQAVMQVMEQRLFGLKASWPDVTCLDVYTNQPIHSFLLDILRVAGRHGINWYLSNPPIRGLAFEMDLRGVRQEIRLET